MSLVLAMNLKNKAVTQYRNYRFDDAAKIGNSYFGVSSDGLYKLEDGDLDDDRVIRTEWALPLNDFGSSYQKRIRRYYVSGQFWGDLIIEVEDDDGNTRSFPLIPEKTDGSQCGAVANISMDGKGRFWKTRIKSEGPDYSIDKIEISIITLSRKPSGVY